MLSDDTIALQDCARAQFSYCHTSSCSNRTTDKQMASVDALLTLLRAIARENEAVHLARRALFITRAAGRMIDHAMATSQLGSSCNILMARIMGLRKLVLEFDMDIAGAEVGSLAELGIRAQTLAVLLLLDELCDAILHRPSLYQELFAGGLKSIEDVVWYVFDSLARINKLWLRHRVIPRIAEPFPTVIGTTHSFPYRAAIRRAQREISELGANPDIAHFLRVGSSGADAPRVRRACDQLVEVFGIALTREPDPAFFLAAAVLEPEDLLDLTDDGETKH